MAGRVRAESIGPGQGLAIIIRLPQAQVTETESLSEAATEDLAALPEAKA